MLAVLLIAVLPSWAQQRKGTVVRKGARQSVRAVSRPKMPVEYVAEYNFGANVPIMLESEDHLRERKVEYKRQSHLSSS